MGSFSDPFWNLLIVVCTLGGIAWLYLLTVQERAPGRAGRDAGRRGGGEETRLGRGSYGARQPLAPLVGDPLLRDPRLRGDLPHAVPRPRQQLDAPRLDAASGVRGGGGPGGGALRADLRGVPPAPRRRGRGGPEGAPDGRAPLRELLRGLPRSRRGRGAGLSEPARLRLAVGRHARCDQDQHPRRGGTRRCRRGATPLGGDAGVDGGDRLRAVPVRKRSVDAARAAAGREKYDALCVACHAPGREPATPPSAGPISPTTCGSTAARRRPCATSIAEGREGRMPAHRDFLGEARVHVLAAWVYSLSHR